MSTRTNLSIPAAGVALIGVFLSVATTEAMYLLKETVELGWVTLDAESAVFIEGDLGVTWDVPDDSLTLVIRILGENLTSASGELELWERSEWEVAQSGEGIDAFPVDTVLIQEIVEGEDDLVNVSLTLGGKAGPFELVLAMSGDAVLDGELNVDSFIWSTESFEKDEQIELVAELVGDDD
jgi:hypothetical protein